MQQHLLCVWEMVRLTRASRTAAAASRELRVPPASIAVDSGTTPRDGVYAINLRVGPQGRSAVCTTDENSAVLGVVYKRPEYPVGKAGAIAAPAGRGGYCPSYRVCPPRD